MQNPFDATITCRYKRGHHHEHVLNVAEAIDDGNGIIIQATVQPNTQADNRMAEEYMEQLPDEGLAQVCIADSAYNSDGLEDLASKKNTGRIISF